MTVRRFVVRGGAFAIGEPFSLPEHVARHVRVLRLAEGDTVELAGAGMLATGTLSTAEDGSLVVTVTHAERAASGRPHLVLVQCLPKGDKVDAIVKMATELGASAIVLAESDHAVVSWDAAKRASKLERLIRVAEEAARQCERADVPDVSFGGSVREAMDTLSACGAKLLVPTPRQSGALRLDAALRDVSLAVVVGPEGGLSAAEEAHADAAGALRFSLGAHVLRVETAAPVAVALVQAALTHLVTD